MVPDYAELRRDHVEFLSGCESTEEIITVAVGAASMCWENPCAAGNFDSTDATALSSAAHEVLALRWSATEEMQKLLAKLRSQEPIMSAAAELLDVWVTYDKHERRALRAERPRLADKLDALTRAAGGTARV